MTRIAGSSQYLNQARLSQLTGSNFDAGNVLGQAASSSLLDAGRGNAVRGVGLSARARQMNTAMLNNNSSTINQMFSLTGGLSATIESAQIQIAGLRATTSLSRDVLIQDDGNVSSSSIGTEIDETV